MIRLALRAYVGRPRGGDYEYILMVEAHRG